MVQFMSIIFFSWISSIFCWVLQKFPFFVSPCITYYECMLVSLGIQHAIRLRHIAICGLFGSTVQADPLVHGFSTRGFIYLRFAAAGQRFGKLNN